MAALRSASVTAALIHEYLIEEDEMGDSTAQSHLLDYLVAVLRWMYRADGWFVARNLTCYHPAIRNSQQMISPDIAVFIGMPLTPDEQWELTRWDMRPPKGASTSGEAKSCPPVMFEVSSPSTWQTDIESGAADKPRIYGAIGARAYFAYDPNRRRPWRHHGGRLLGWRYDEHGQPVALTPDARGWLWSADLDSWLVPDGRLLHLYDAQGRPRLTEAAAMEAQAESERHARQEAESARQEAQVQAETERHARQEAEAMRHQLEGHLAALQVIVKAHNIDPQPPVAGPGGDGTLHGPGPG